MDLFVSCSCSKARSFQFKWSCGGSKLNELTATTAITTKRNIMIDKFVGGVRCGVTEVADTGN
jgi:hypothetical protein